MEFFEFAKQYGLPGIMLAYIMGMHLRLEIRLEKKEAESLKQAGEFIAAIVSLREAVSGIKDILNRGH